MQYLVRTESKGTFSDWELLSAKTASGAKRVSSRKFADQCLYLQIGCRKTKGGEIKLLATKHSLQVDWLDYK